MRAKLVNETIRHLGARSNEEILKNLLAAPPEERLQMDWSERRLSDEQRLEAIFALPAEKRLGWANFIKINLSKEQIQKIEKEILENQIKRNAFKEKAAKDSVDKIKAFAKENNLSLNINKKGTMSVSIPVYYQSSKGYDQSSWPILVTEVAYTFTFTDNEKPISLRKIIYGHEPDSNIFRGLNSKDFDLKKIIAKLDNMNEAIRHLSPRPEDEIEKNTAEAKKRIFKNPVKDWIKLAQQERIQLSNEERQKSLDALQKHIISFLKTDKNFLKEKNLNQSLMGRFDNIEDALDRIKINIAKERKKK